MQKLADCIGLPCRIARGCKYCTTDHRSSCLVKIKDDKQLPRLVLPFNHDPWVYIGNYTLRVHNPHVGSVLDCPPDL